MAKSLRSKRRRKMRAVKRVRYGEKELERLKKALANDPLAVKKESDVVMQDLTQVAEVTTVENIKNKRKNKPDNTENADAMEDDAKTRVYNKNMKDKYGSYPVWMHQRKIREKVKAYKKKAKINKKNKKKTKK